MNTLEKYHVYSSSRADKKFNDIVLVQVLDIELKKNLADTLGAGPR